MNRWHLHNLCSLFVISTGVGAACCTPGVLTSLLLIAPNYSGTLNSLAMLFGQIACGLAPNMVALMQKKVCFLDEYKLMKYCI